MKGLFRLHLELVVSGICRQEAALSRNGSSLEHVQKEIFRDVETSLVKN